MEEASDFKRSAKDRQERLKEMRKEMCPVQEEEEELYGTTEIIEQEQRMRC